MIKHRVDTLINENDVKRKVTDLGEQITVHYQSLFAQQSSSDTAPQLVLIGLLRGSFIFMADLARSIGVSHEIDFMTVSSYGSGTKTSGDVKILKDLDEDIAGKHVLVVEDIIDSGNTLSKVKQLLALRNPASIKLCTLLDKPSRRETDVDIDWCGFSIEDLYP